MRLRTIIIIAISGLIVAAMALRARKVEISSETPVVPQPTAIGRSLPLANSAQAIEIKNAKASTTAPNVLKDLSCVVRNNTDKAITALVLAWKVSIQKGDETTSSTELQATDFFVDADIQKARGLEPIAVAEERRLSPTGVARYPDDYTIKQVEVTINYVEFADKTAISPDVHREGEKRIAGVREGATRYKTWLRQAYSRQGKSIDPIISQLKSSRYPAELNLNTAHLQNGAKAYRIFLLDLYTNQGATTVTAYLN